MLRPSVKASVKKKEKDSITCLGSAEIVFIRMLPPIAVELMKNFTLVHI